MTLYKLDWEWKPIPEDQKMSEYWRRLGTVCKGAKQVPDLGLHIVHVPTTSKTRRKPRTKIRIPPIPKEKRPFERLKKLCKLS